MRKVADSDLALFLDVREEGSLVIHLEGEDAVLVGQLERGAEDGAIRCCAEGLEGQALEGRQHREF